ncbi:MAG: retropepsin-like aspartic protease [Blastocatellia bacterium]
MIQLTFTQEYNYPDEQDGIPLPATLNYHGKTITAGAKVDTGAAVCLFKREHAEELGIPVEQGIPTLLGNLGGTIEAFGHEVSLQTGEFAFQSVVYFARYPGLPRNILGRQGWLRNIRLAVIDYDNLLYLSPYDS